MTTHVIPPPPSPHSVVPLDPRRRPRPVRRLVFAAAALFVAYLPFA